MNEDTTTEQIHAAPLGKRMLQGASIALIPTLLFLLTADGLRPAWMVRPLFTVSIAGATGGVLYYVINHLRCRGGWRKTMALVVSLIAYVVLLCLGVMLGMDITLRN